MEAEEVYIPDDIEFDDYVELGKGEFERVFRSKLPDGTPTVGRMACQANVEPSSIIIFEEGPADGSKPREVRRFTHGTPENALSVLCINGMAGHFIGMIRTGHIYIRKNEIVEE